MSCAILGRGTVLHAVSVDEVAYCGGYIKLVIRLVIEVTVAPCLTVVVHKVERELFEQRRWTEDELLPLIRPRVRRRALTFRQVLVHPDYGCIPVCHK